MPRLLRNVFFMVSDVIFKRRPQKKCIFDKFDKKIKREESYPLPENGEGVLDF